MLVGNVCQVGIGHPADELTAYISPLLMVHITDNGNHIVFVGVESHQVAPFSYKESSVNCEAGPTDESEEICVEHVDQGQDRNVGLLIERL